MACQSQSHSAGIRLNPMESWRNWRATGAHTMSTISNRTDKLFMDASLSDDGLGYPAEVAFVPADEVWADEVVLRTLIEGRPTVVMATKFELLTPQHRSLVDRLRGHVEVTVTQRVDG